MKKCKYCSGKFKLIKKEHVIRTRRSQESDFIVEDLHTLECTVCGYTTLTESSEQYVQFIREKIRREMAHRSNPTVRTQPTQQPTHEKEKVNIAALKEKLRKWIG